MAPLTRKLARDLWRVKGQASAIAAVIAVGVMMLVMMTGLVNSLQSTKAAYYAQYHFAQVFASVSRAPQSALQSLADIDDVVAVDRRISGGALIDFPAESVPIRAKVLSLPDVGSPILNRYLLTGGRAIRPNHNDEILLLDGFTKARSISLGDTLDVTLYGTQRRLTVVGFARSPEFIYTTAPGEFAPDDKRFAVIWMSETALAAAFDLEGAFNEILLTLSPSANIDHIIEQLDNRLQPFGGRGAYARSEHLSERFVAEEIGGLAAMARSMPPIFLLVAAFLLNIVVSRMVQAEREQIGLLKAFGYSSIEISWHYLQFILLIALAGATLGSVAGLAAGDSMSEFYQLYFKFPVPHFTAYHSAIFLGYLVSLLAAALGASSVLSQVMRLTPAESMRPAPPADFSRSIQLQSWLTHLLDQPTKMVIREIIRRPLRTLASIVGISITMALSVSMMSLLSGFDSALELNFGTVDRSSLAVSFIEPKSDKTLVELRRLPGVIKAEPFRQLGAILKHNRHRYRTAITGLVAEPELFRAMTTTHRPIYIRSEGIIISSTLADILEIRPGEMLTVDITEGARPILTLPVINITQTLLGVAVYTQLETLNRAMGQANRVSGAYLLIDAQKADGIYQQLKNMPTVAGVSIKSEARKEFKSLMDTGAGAMRYLMALMAGIITYGIVYNSARIAFSERSRDLASLRVIGMTQAELGFILLGELGIIVFVALILGALMGYPLGLVVANAFSTDLYAIPALYSKASIGIAALAVILSSLISGWFIQRDLARLDLVTALKFSE
jgi:putative ABC transport system permease protein